MTQHLVTGPPAIDPATAIPTAQATDYWTPTPADLPKVPAVAAYYWNTVNQPQRSWLVDAVAAVGGAESLLELGCQAGPNLRALRRASRGMVLHGIDINAPALEQGRRLIRAEGLRGIHLYHGTVPDALQTWADQSVDVVATVYCLAYIGPDRFAETLTHALRIARRAVILIEPFATKTNPPEQVTVEGSTYVEWRHDYLGTISDVLDSGAPGLPDQVRLAIVPTVPHKSLNGVLIAGVRHAS